ncbi:MAG: hypothetical protein LUI05_08865 [Oscillospiraceae bacterium]|nr:hypothetical protein [Oscillospiraceae bacterium]
MKNYAILTAAVCSAAVIMCGCDDYYPTNAPRETVTMKSNALTTVTTIETTRADTYSEYISSLREMEQSIRDEESNSGGISIQRDTALSTEKIESQQRETAVPRESGTEVTAVTAVPDEESDSEEDTDVTVVCEPVVTEAVTAVPFELSDIPAVPSENVQAETAVTD